MSQFSTAMQATIRVPQEGFTVDELKAHMRASKVSTDARLRPTIVRDATPPPNEDGSVDDALREVGFIAEWTQ